MDPLPPDLPPVPDPCSFGEVPEEAMAATWGALRTHSPARRPDADLDDRPTWTTGCAAGR